MQRLGRFTTCGFTILEMLIAMGITIIMLGVISRLFFDTTNAVSQGAALSQIIANSRSVSDQLDRDAMAIAGAQQGGFIVIVNKIITNVPMKTRKDGEKPRSVRADQLVFIRNINNIEHIAPGTTLSFAPANPANVQAPFARVWYGHVRRTHPNGTDSGTGDLDNHAQSNPNRVGTNWILGRQALMLREINGGINIYTNTAQYDSPITGLGNTPIPPPRLLYMGLSDVCNNSLADINADLAGALNQTQYRNRAYNYAFIEQRLRANPIPDGITFDSWQIGQMHPVFMENVSDFVVEFAADVTDDPALPNDPTLPPFPDLEPDTNLATGNIEWYGLGHIPPVNDDWNDNYPAEPGSPYHSVSADEARWVFRHDYGNNWPYMIRIRYRIHDPNGRFEEWVGDSTAVGGRQSGQWFEQIIRVR